MENNALYWVGFILIGGVIGYLTGYMLKGRGFGIAGDVVLGIGGAVLGGWLFGALGLFRHGTLGSFSLMALMCTIGAVTIAHYIKSKRVAA